MANNNKEKEREKEADELYQLYADYNKILRTWLVAYGIGGPILFATNAALNTPLKNSGHSKTLVGMFLVGVALQVFNAFLNKWVGWHLYSGVEFPSFRKKTAYIFWSKLSDWYWIDFSFDCISIILFGIATAWVLSLV